MAEAAAAAIAPRPLLIVGTASSGPRSRPRIRRPRPAVFCARTTYDNALPRDHRFVATQEPGLQPFFACGVRQRRYMAFLRRSLHDGYAWRHELLLREVSRIVVRETPRARRSTT